LFFKNIGSQGSTFESYEGSQPNQSGQQPPQLIQQQQQQQQRLQNNTGLELPALFHEGRRASDGLMCQSPSGGSTPTSPRRGTVHHHQERVAIGAVDTTPLLSETNREHKTLCQQYGRPSRPVLRQVSYKLAQQQPVLLGTPVSAQCHPIEEADGSSEVSPDHDPDDPRMTAMMMRTTSELDEWCRLPSSLAACDLSNLPTDQT